MSKTEQPETQLVEYETDNNNVAIDCVYIYQHGEDVIAIGIQTEKRCELSSTGSDDGVPLVMLDVRNSPPMLPGTTISLPQYKGWNIWSADISKYTVHLCLTRNVK